MNKSLEQEISLLLSSLGIGQEEMSRSKQLTILLVIILITYITTKLFRHIVIPIIHKITAKTKAKWDDCLFNDKMMKAFSRIIPPVMFYSLLPFAFRDVPHILGFMQKICLIYLDIVSLLLIGTFLKSLYEISSEHETLKNRPLKGIYQMINLIVIVIGIIIMISILLEQNPTAILAGLGASAAVLMLVFKDSILGLVAGVQLSANDMLRPGDWITMPKYGADGYVIEVSLTTVKVQNFDKTITTIPPYVLVSDSFQNWRGMRETGARRIKRSLNIDVNTIRFCSKEYMERLISKKLVNIKDFEEGKTVNLSLFRNYIVEYLKSRSDINKELMIMVRQLQPASDGMPIEIYCFTDTPDWLPYETIQSEVFEHVIAMAPEFGLRIFQRPAGTDFLQNEV